MKLESLVIADQHAAVNNKVAVSEGAAGSPPFYGELMNAVHQYKFPCFVFV